MITREDIIDVANSINQHITEDDSGHLYRDPQCSGTDTYGFIISKEKLTRKEIREITKFD